MAVVGTLAAHHDDGTPMPAATTDFHRMCPWSYTRPDAHRPAAATFVQTARHTAGNRQVPPPEAPKPLAGQLDLLDLLTATDGETTTH